MKIKYISTIIFLSIVFLIFSGCGSSIKSECETSSNSAHCESEKEAQREVKIGASCQELSGEAYEDCEKSYAPQKHTEEVEKESKEIEGVIKHRSAEESANAIESIK